MSHSYPAVLSLSGHDPSGGAGIQADIETLASHRCHAVNVITCLTEQDSRNVIKLIPQSPTNILSQAITLLSDISVKAIKIGLLGHPDIIESVHSILKQHPEIPVIFDPVLAAGGGTDLSSDRLIELINDLLLPCTTVLTPNSTEARRLTGLSDLKECGLSLLKKGCGYVLITGTHENSTNVSNLLFHNGECIDSYSWNRLPHSYHGSGCTLAASIAGLIAQGLDIPDAVREAQEYTWSALAHGYRPGEGQHIPNRFFWVDEE
jgi:hydroxymethylpyrimidine/phosphomethylpyrimidine kinase